MTEDDAYALFRKVRWPETDGDPVCPRCGCCDAYEITTRRKFKCKACHHQYSVTSGTIFASRKLSFTDMLAAVRVVAVGQRGFSAAEIARELGVQHRTAWLFARRMRGVLAGGESGFDVRRLMDGLKEAAGGHP